ncbi:MAG: hypothetical protein KIT87_19630 [Anaerolineae bacterium]|nr:hypothetical protein [Anaerolineae bacterium]
MTDDQPLTTDYRLQAIDYGLLTTAALWFLLVFWGVQWLAPRLPGPSVLSVLGSALLVILATGPLEYVVGQLDWPDLRRWTLLILVGLVGLAANVWLTTRGQPALASLGLLLGVIPAGVLIGRYALVDRDFLLIVAVLYIIVDVYSVFFGPTQVIIQRGGPLLSVLTVRFPILGTERVASLVGAADFLVWAACLQGAYRFGFPYRLSFAALSLGLVGSAVVSVALQRSVPALPLMMLAYLLVNAGQFEWRKRSLWALAGGLLAVVLVIGVVIRTWLLR